MTIAPSNKIATSGATGILTAFIIYELTNRFHITIAPEEASFITFLLSFIAGYFTPHSQPQQQPPPNPPLNS